MHDPTRATTRTRWRAVVGVLSLGLVTLALHRLDNPLLVPPDLADPAAWPTWAATVGPVGMLMSLLRLAAVGMCWYLLVAAGLQMAANVTGARRLTRLADLVISARTKDVLVAVVGTGLLASATLEVGATSARPEDEGPRMSYVDAREDDRTVSEVTDHTAGPRLRSLGPSTTDAPDDPRGDDAPQLRRIRDGAATAPSMTLLELEATTAPSMTRLDREVPTAPPDADADGADDEPDHDDDRRWWTVAPGDHFWLVAEEQVSRSGDRPSESRIRTYWRRLVDVNRDRLLDPDNPDLLLPGQVLLLPPSSDPEARR